MAETMEFQSDGPHRPSFRFEHTACGSDMGRFPLANGDYAYHCPECDETITLNLSSGGEISRYRLEQK